MWRVEKTDDGHEWHNAVSGRDVVIILLRIIKVPGDGVPFVLWVSDLLSVARLSE